MEKFQNIKCINDLIGMGDEAVIEFVNKSNQMIKNHEITTTEIKHKYGMTISSAKDYLAKQCYATKNGTYLNRKRNARKRRSSVVPTEAFTRDEIAKLREMIQRSEVIDYDKKDIETVTGEKTKKQCIYFTDDVEQKFNHFCKEKKSFNKSEHVMLALLEYIEKYK